MWRQTEPGLKLHPIPLSCVTSGNLQNVSEPILSSVKLPYQLYGSIRLIEMIKINYLALALES